MGSVNWSISLITCKVIGTTTTTMMLKYLLPLLLVASCSAFSISGLFESPKAEAPQLMAESADIVEVEELAMDHEEEDDNDIDEEETEENDDDEEEEDYDEEDDEEDD